MADVETLTELEEAAVSFVNAKTDFDACRYAKRPWKTYEQAWRRLRAAVEAAKQESQT